MQMQSTEDPSIVIESLRQCDAEGEWDINFYSCKIGRSGALAVAEHIIRADTLIKRYYLCFNSLGDESVCIIAKACMSPGNIVEVLDFCGNDCTDVTATALAHVIQHENNNLKEIVMMDPLGDKAIALLARSIGHENCKLEKLSLRACHFGLEGARELANALTRKANTLERLCIEMNPNIGDDGLALVCQALVHPNCQLRDLTITVQDYSEVALHGLVRAVKKSLVLHVYCSSIDLSHPLMEFAQAMYDPWFAVMSTLAAVHVLRKKQTHMTCYFRMLPKDMLRVIAVTLGWTFPDYSPLNL